jgi:hypothetical protein
VPQQTQQQHTHNSKHTQQQAHAARSAHNAHHAAEVVELVARGAHRLAELGAAGERVKVGARHLVVLLGQQALERLLFFCL